MSSKAAVHPLIDNSLLNQNLDSLLNDKFLYQFSRLASSPPTIDYKSLVDNYFRENSKKSKKNSDAFTNERQSSCYSKDFDEKSLNIIGSLRQLNIRYKTELCRAFTEEGRCKYGSKCQYAHGTRELRPAYRHLKHKTKLCYKFHSTGFCNYGSRCTYIHNEEDDMSFTVNKISPSPPVANNAFSFPPLVRLPSISSSSSSDSPANSYESGNSSPISFDGNNFTFAPSPYFTRKEKC